MAKDVTLKPALTEGQWARVLFTEEIPELEPDQTAALILFQLGYFSPGDSRAHRTIGDRMQLGINELKMELTKHETIRTNAELYFNLRQQLEGLRRSQEWHYDMADRIAALLPPPSIMERLRKEQEKHESERVEEEDRGGEGPSDRDGRPHEA